MPTPILCDAPAQGAVLRLLLLDSCGVPVSGTGSAMVVTDGFTQVAWSPQYQTGDRKFTRKANGTQCQNYKLPDQYTNDQLTIDHCSWNPGELFIVIGARLLTATQSPTGTGFAHGTWANDELNHFSLEVWGLPTTCDSSGNPIYPYYAWPHLSDGKRGDGAINADPTMLQLIANTYDASPLWAPVGADWLGADQVAFGDHILRNLTNTAPPPSACVLQDY